MDSYTPSEGPQPKLNRHGWVKEMLQTMLMMLAIYTLLNLATPLRQVEGNSMEPNFHDGQRLFINRVVYMIGKPQRGDVVVIRNPKHADGEDLIKRIVGLPGEAIEIIEGKVFINDKPLDEPYIEALLKRPGAKTWTLGPDEYFVLGDNRNNSNDSYDFGPIKRETIVGRAWISYWPLRWLRMIPQPNYDIMAQPAVP